MTEDPGKTIPDPGSFPIDKWQEYVCGFMFDITGSDVLLIKKNRPKWQEGKWNGIGGKIYTGESAVTAMVREFKEETGVETCEGKWNLKVNRYSPISQVFFFWSIGNLRAAKQTTDEEIGIFSVTALPLNVIDNLRWLIPLMKDKTVEIVDVTAHH